MIALDVIKREIVGRFSNFKKTLILLLQNQILTRSLLLPKEIVRIVAQKYCIFFPHRARVGLLFSDRFDTYNDNKNPFLLSPSIWRFCYHSHSRNLYIILPEWFEVVG
jgi:hypothetical protein